MRIVTQTYLPFHNCTFSLFITLTVISDVQGDNAVFFDKANYQGNSFALGQSGGCYNFKSKWVGTTSSVQVDRKSCIIAWNHENCTGQSTKLLPNSKDTVNLQNVGFDKKIKSTSLCTEISFRIDPVVMESSLRMWNPTRQHLNGGKKGDSDLPDSDDGRTRQRVELNFYDEPNFRGSIFTLTTNGECYNFKPKWTNRISSLDSGGHCIAIWSGGNCVGEEAILPATGAQKESMNLDLIGFNKRIQSVRLCSLPHKASESQETENTGRNSGGGDDNSYEELENDKINDEEVKKIAISEHNKLRQLHGVPDLKWDFKIQNVAKIHADWLAKRNKFEHSKNEDLGENIAGISTSSKIDALKQAIQLWYNEIQNYNFDDPITSVLAIKAGHFTQLIWRSTMLIGLAIAWDPKRQWYVVVCNYSPPGNYKGEYENNVLPPIHKDNS